MRYATSLLILALAASPACKKKHEGGDMGSAAGSAMGSGSDQGSGSAMGSATGSGSAGSAMGSAGSGSDAGSAAAGQGAGSGSGSADAQMAHHAGNCPSTVLNSTTKAEVKGKEVIVTITSDDTNAVKGIQKRTDELLGAKKDTKGVGMGHDQKGMHGGGIGLCPVYVPEGAKATAKHDKKGVIVAITPKEAPAALKAEIDSRIQKAADWVKTNIKRGDKANEGGVGGGSGNDGMNHSGSGDAKGIERKRSGGDGTGGGKGTGGGGGKGTGGGTTKGK